MNERITAYLNEVYGIGSKNAQSLAQLVAAFEQKYETKVWDILISEDSGYVNTGRDDRGSLNSEKVVFDIMALFCERYIAFISIQPERTKLSYFMAYSSIKDVSFNDVDSYMKIEGYYLEKVKGHPHWAMDVIRTHFLPRFK